MSHNARQTHLEMVVKEYVTVIMVPHVYRTMVPVFVLEVLSGKNANRGSVHLTCSERNVKASVHVI